MNKMKSCVLYVICLILFGFLPAFSADLEEIITETCVLESIIGGRLITSCDEESSQEFLIGEEIKITDITGRPIKIWQLPMNSDIEITHKCLTEDICAYAIKVVLQRRIIPQPE